MKIILVSTFFHPVVGGVESHVASLAKELDKLGHQVTIATSDSGKNGPRIREKNDRSGNVEIVRFRYLFSFSYFHKWFPGIFWYLLRADYDLIHAHGFRKPETYLALFAAKWRKKKIILTSHNPFPTRSRSRISELFIKLHDKLAGKFLTKHFDKIIVLVNSEKKIFTNAFNVPSSKLIKISNGIDENYYSEGSALQFYKDWDIKPDKWDAIVAGVGRISYVKGYQNLDMAIRRLKDTLFFIAGGDDGYLRKLRLMFKNYPNVIFSSRHLSLEKLRDLYNATDIFVFPSEHEAFGMALIEAMTQGTPVISSNVGGPSEIVDPEFGILLDPHDQEGWKNAIAELTRNKEKREKMGTAAAKEAQKYRWSKIAKKINQLYLDTDDHIRAKTK